VLKKVSPKPSGPGAPSPFIEKIDDFISAHNGEEVRKLLSSVETKSGIQS
jgi:hypothetical protein